MKTAFKFLMTLTICMFTLWSCSDDESSVTLVEGEGQVTFSFNVINDTNTSTNGNKSFRNSQLVKRTPNQIVVTIQSTDDGSIVYDKEKLDVIAFNGSFISDPIALKTGNYELTEYFVLDEDGNTLYVTPLEGSTLAYLVNDPLGTNFSIAKDDSKQITPEVITPEGFDADDFGYTDFSFDIVETIDFLISAHIFDEASESYELTDATILVTADGTEVYNNSIANVTEQIRVRDGYNSYTITITKAGYDDYVVTLTNAELELHANKPLIVILSLSTVVQSYDVFAKENSVSGGAGLIIGEYEVGQTVVINTDPNDIWNLLDNDPGFNSNADGGLQVNPNSTFPNGIAEFKHGTLVGSFDNGTTFFKVGTQFQTTVTAASELKLYCWDSDSDNNTGSIKVTVTTTR
ncbi:hypothetical protein [Tenacibaculum agarivorans]|uniref:hypothetical protein n=1 Tax=Tenacibaculum agarivorans TaxID=1908389 RepID=UPI000A914C85|nr:hypothetical protein [Tenacibaculum agarivorans]